MKLVLTRDTLQKDETLGKLYIDGVFECFTLEDTDRHLEENTDRKVYGETAIPRGTYEVSITHSVRFNKDLPLLHNVPRFSGVRIHAGNTNADTLGCILVGTARNNHAVVNSRIAFSRLFEKMQRASSSGDEILITIR